LEIVDDVSLLEHTEIEFPNKPDIFEESPLSSELSGAIR
jgi:hypothetical protein